MTIGAWPEHVGQSRSARAGLLVEHVIGSLKRFRILAERYRNRRKRFGLRFNLLAAIFNLELAS